MKKKENDEKRSIIFFFNFKNFKPIMAAVIVNKAPVFFCRHQKLQYNHFEYCVCAITKDECKQEI